MEENQSENKKVDNRYRKEPLELYMAPNRRVKLEGQTFGRFIDVKYIGTIVGGKTMYECTCECGNKKIVQHGNLLSGHTTSCGCYKPQTTHGESKTSLHSVWLSIKQRCFNPNANGYKNYGGRGITMSDEFASDFAAFKAYMGEKPTRKSSIERIDVNGNYERGNIVWAEPMQQAMNKRKRNDNSTGVTGVYRQTKGNSDYFIAFIGGVGERRTKCFNISHLGEEQAFELAVKYRQKLVEEFNSKGAMFTENHGK